MYDILLEELALCGWREVALEALEKIEARENQACKFCKSVGHNEEECRSFDLMRERTYDSYKVQNDPHGNDGYGYHGSTSGRTSS